MAPVDVCLQVQALVLHRVVHSAGVQDRAAARRVLHALHQRLPAVELIWADGGYSRYCPAGGRTP
jgi:hypothetical protein